VWRAPLLHTQRLEIMAGMPDITVPGAWRARLDALAGKRRDVWVLAALVSTVALGALLLWKRNAPVEVAPPAVAHLPAAATAVPASPQAGVSPGPALLIHVAGAVRKPGLYELPHGARVADAIEAAGGPVRRADVGALNLAEPVADGAKVYLPRRGEVAQAPTAAATPVPASGATPAAVSINTADQAALETIPGIGPVKAAAIIQYREEAGGFSSIDQLMDVSGIGPATLESVRPYVTL
jgi:competence protein ComEA